MSERICNALRWNSMKREKSKIIAECQICIRASGVWYLCKPIIRCLHAKPKETCLILAFHTWGSLVRGLLWCCRLPFPQGRGILSLHQWESAPSTAPGPGNQATGQRSDTSWSRGSTRTNQTSRSPWASRRTGRSMGSHPGCIDCRGEEEAREENEGRNVCLSLNSVGI